MEGRRFIRTIRLDRILSFGPNEEAFQLEPLNVLIGPNASGKSNLIEGLTVLNAAPSDLQLFFSRGTGVDEWFWKGEEAHDYVASIGVTLDYPSALFEKIPIEYSLALTGGKEYAYVFGESVRSELPLENDEGNSHTYFSNFYPLGEVVIEAVAPCDGNRYVRQLEEDDVDSGQSILLQKRDSQAYPEISFLAREFEKMSFYREWNFGRYSPARTPQKADLKQGWLLEDASNLSLVLSHLTNLPAAKDRILKGMRNFYPSFRDVMVPVTDGMVQVFFHEDGMKHAIPATRLSDGSLRYLCLLAILLHPEPPNVICIEEPELGLHPDIIPEVGKLLIEGSKRSQIFVTTHSDILVDSLSEVPESVVVCEKVDGATQLRRLDGESLKPWLEKYRLGELWTSGRFGGNRW